jgi:hypothetical protein
MIKFLPDRIDLHFGIAGFEGYHVNWDGVESRVADILGVEEGDQIPLVSRQMLKTYHAYLRANVKFPFKAKVEDLDGDATIESLLPSEIVPISHFMDYSFVVITGEVLSKFR